MGIALLWFWRFILYSFIGWLMESILFTIEARHWVNRGFLTGPICPIYGSGAVLILLILTPLQNMPALLALAGIVLATTLEYMTGWLMETIFHTRWWDYSRRRFNLHGRICLLNSLAWGVLSIVLVYGLNPLADRLIGSISQTWQMILAAVALVFFFADLITTVIGAINLNRQLAKLQDVVSLIRRKNSEFGENMQQRLAFLTKNLRDWSKISEKIDPIQRRLLEAFPDLHSLRYPEALQRLRRWLNRPKKKQIWPSADITLLRNQLPTLRRKK